MTLPADIFAKMQTKFDASAADGLTEIFQYHIDDHNWQVIIDNGSCEIVEGTHDDPAVSLTMSIDTFAGVASGEIDGMQAFMSGDITASGDVMLATKIPSIFPNS